MAQVARLRPLVLIGPVANVWYEAGGWCRHLNVSTSVFGVNTAVPSLGLGPTLPGNIDCIFVNRHIGKRGNPLLGIILSSPPSWTRQADKISDVLSVVVSNTKYFLLISCKTHQSSWILEPSPSYQTGNQFSWHLKSNGRKCTMQLFGIVLAFSFNFWAVRPQCPQHLRVHLHHYRGSVVKLSLG